MKRLISLGLVVAPTLLAACGNAHFDKLEDDFDTVRDDLTVEPVKSGDVRAGLSGPQGGEQHFSIDVPAGATNLRFRQSGGTGDADLYVRFGADPTRRSFDFRPFTTGNDESVTPNPVRAGTWYFMVRGFSAYSGVSVVATFDAPPVIADAGSEAAPPPVPPPTMPPPTMPPPPPTGTIDCTVASSWPAQWADFEDQVLVLVNQRRAAGATCGGTAKPPVPALTLDVHLRQAARCHSLDMATRNYFDHTSAPPDGRSPWTRITDAGYTAFGNAENIAAGQDSPASVMDSWMNSPGHCNNVMTAGSNEIGIGFALVTSSDFDRYWTQDFGQR